MTNGNNEKRHFKDFKDNNDTPPKTIDKKKKRRIEDNNISPLTTTDTIKNGSLLVLSAVSAGDAFGNYIPVLRSICDLCEVIVRLYDTIKENKTISLALINRVELAHVAIKQMEREKEENEENFRKESYFKAFNRLEAVLKNIENFIKYISSYGGIKKFFNAEHIKKCYNDHVKNLEGACVDLQFNVILSSYHTMKQQDNNMEKYFAKICEKFENFETRQKNVETMQKSELVLIEKLSKCSSSDDLEFNPIIKLARIDPRDICNVESSHKKPTDIRGANKRVVKKLLRKTVEVASKAISNYPKDDDTPESKKFQANLAILNAIQCKYIIKFYGISNVDCHNALIFGWAEKGNLKDLYNTHYIDWVTKLKISYDVIRGLFFMHNGEILHHDVKCENILIDEDGNAKVSNFELSRNLSGETSRIPNLSIYIPWLAPEKIESTTQLYNLACEMFSFGMFLWELTYQQIPYKGKSGTSIVNHVLSGQRETIRSGVHNVEIQQVLIQIITRAWEHSPYNRPSFDEIKNELAESWKSFENIKYMAKFIPKDKVSSDEIQNYNIDKDSDFKVVEKTLFKSPIPLDEGVKAYEEKDYEKAWKCFCENADLDNHDAIYWKACYLQNGEEASEEDKEKAVELYKIAADNGMAKAQYSYASLIYEKDKIANLKEFKKYLQLAAENGYEVALYFLGYYYFKGINGYEKDHDKAINYLKCVAFQNHNEQISWDATNIINQINQIKKIRG